MRTVFSPTKKFSQVSPNFKVAFEYIEKPASFCQVTKFFVLWQLSFVRSSYFANKTNKSSFNWRFWLHEKFRVSQVRTRLQIFKYRFSNFCKRKMRYVLNAAYHTSTLACVQPPPPLRGKAEKGPFSVFFFFLGGGGGGGGSAVHRLPPLLSAKIKTVVENAPY